jgi:hypothetical protein
MWLRLRQIALVAAELDPVVDDLTSILGIEVCFQDPGVAHFGLHNKLMPVGNQFLEVVAPIQENTAGGRYLQRRGGDTGYMVITQCDEQAPRRARIEELGVRLVTDHRWDGFANMQLHPKDTGGTFFEIDQQEGGEALDGLWVPAGPDWQQHVRTDVVSAITAAEIQSPEPERVAARWSEIAEIDLLEGEDGAPTMTLDNAAVRFVEATDGRGEGLGAIDVAAVDKDRVLATAEQRDRRTGDDQDTIGGLRINLRPAN